MPYRTPFLTFDRADWRKFRHDTPLTLTEVELERIRGRNETISLTEVAEVYLPIARLLNLYVEATQELYRATSKFLGNPAPRVPYIIGVAGSVAVGKSTISRLLQTLLSRWPAHREVAIVTTDGFLLTNAELEQRGLMERKGFPESYDVQKLLTLLEKIKSGETNLTVPLYSHEYYDLLPGKMDVALPGYCYCGRFKCVASGFVSTKDRHPSCTYQIILISVFTWMPTPRLLSLGT